MLLVSLAQRLLMWSWIVRTDLRQRSGCYGRMLNLASLSWLLWTPSAMSDSDMLPNGPWTGNRRNHSRQTLRLWLPARRCWASPCLN